MGTNTPHDALFRFTFSRMENAAGELRAVLPAALVSKIDWTTLRIEDGHYVDPELEQLESDIVYTAAIHGQPVVLYLLFEHQSTEPALMALRLLRYMVRIWDRWLGDHEGSQTIPVIVPVVLSHVEGGWRGATSMQELYALPAEVLEAVSANVPRFELVLDDLTRCTDDELRGRALAALGSVALGLFRWGRSGAELLDHLMEYSEALRAMWHAPDGAQALRAVYRYLALAKEPVTLQDLTSRLVAVVGEEAREVVMTEGQMMIDQWRAEGRAEGEARGLAQGEAKGVAKGLAEALLVSLQGHQLSVSEELRERILGCKDPATLQKWIIRVATAKSAAEVVSEG
jgi:hypothetical protein